MDRVMVYPGAIPLETDILRSNKYALIGLAKLSALAIGTAMIANGLACVPTGPASLQVVVNPGEIYSSQAVDGTAYSSVVADAHLIQKQGILMDAVTLNCPAPSTAGQSINYLIQASYLDADSLPVVLPYYNAANPGVAWSGPGGLGATNNTVRLGSCVVAVKAGTAATTGSQITPSPDAGNIGLWVVTVANGQTTITSGNIAAFSGAPIMPSSLLAAVQTGSLSTATAGGTANAITASFPLSPIAYASGQPFTIIAAAANTGAMTAVLTLGGTVQTSVPIVKGANQALVAGDNPGAGYPGEYNYSPTYGAIVMQNPATGVINVAALITGKNRVINGSMQVDQRNVGASKTITAAAALAYTIDRWYAYCTGANVTGQQIAGTTGVSRKAYKFTGAASVTGFGFGHRIEAANIVDLATLGVTLSAVLSSSSLTALTWTAYYANTADTFGTLASPTRTQIATGSFTISSTPTKYNAQISLPSNAANGVEIVFSGGALLAAQTLQIENVQLEAGSNATPFEMVSLQHTLSLCQRYFEKSYSQTVVPGAVSSLGAIRVITDPSGGSSSLSPRFVVPKRVVPAVIVYSPNSGASGNFSIIGAGDIAATTQNIGDTGLQVNGTTTTNTQVHMHFAADAEL